MTPKMGMATTIKKRSNVYIISIVKCYLIRSLLTSQSTKSEIETYDETYDGLVTTGHFQQLSLEIEK